MTDAGTTLGTGKPFTYLLTLSLTVLLTVALFAATPSVAIQPAIAVAATNAVPGEPVLLNVRPVAGAQLKVVSSGISYRFIGDPRGVKEFVPTKAGAYTALLIDPTGATVASADFSVIGTTTTDSAATTAQQPMTDATTAPSSTTTMTDTTLQSPLRGPLGPVQSCGTLSVDASLTQDVSASGTGCFVINASDVTLDCQGRSITGDGTNGTIGVLISGVDNVTVRNCLISGFGQGILLDGTSRNDTIENDTVTASTETALNVSGNVSTGSSFLSDKFCGSGSVDAADAGSNTWTNATCDTAQGNAACAASCKDLVAGAIAFGGDPLVEGVSINVSANITNDGLSDIGAFTVQFWVGTPGNGAQLGSNISVQSLAVGQGFQAKRTLTLVAGTNVVTVVADVADAINESDEANNDASGNVTVPIYQYFYGSVRQDITLDSAANRTLLNRTDTNGSGFILVAGGDARFSFADLRAIGRYLDGSATMDDLSDIDAVLNTMGTQDSVKAVWGNGTDTPVATRTFNLSTGAIADVPVVESTNTSSFVTGILWDSADDTGDGQYDTTDKEDLVFVTAINRSREGAFGMYDYEIRVPAALRSSGGVTLYSDLV